VARIRIETRIEAPVELVFDLARDIDFHQRSMAHTGERAVAGTTTGLIGLGETVTWRARHLRREWSLTSRITELDAPNRFVDEQVSGPFASFRHQHRFESLPGGTLMIDEWEHRPPFGPVGRVADALFLARLMRRLLMTRNEALRREADGHSESPSRQIPAV
jgi:ligand-binding SRPBCC domain-containing protein